MRKKPERWNLATGVEDAASVRKNLKQASSTLPAPNLLSGITLSRPEVSGRSRKTFTRTKEVPTLGFESRKRPRKTSTGTSGYNFGCARYLTLGVEYLPKKYACNFN